MPMRRAVSLGGRLGAGSSLRMSLSFFSEASTSTFLHAHANRDRNHTQSAAKKLQSQQRFLWPGSRGTSFGFWRSLAAARVHESRIILPSAGAEKSKLSFTCKGWDINSSPRIFAFRTIPAKSISSAGTRMFYASSKLRPALTRASRLLQALSPPTSSGTSSRSRGATFAGCPEDVQRHAASTSLASFQRPTEARRR